jgi:hypothetical protein
MNKLIIMGLLALSLFSCRNGYKESYSLNEMNSIKHYTNVIIGDSVTTIKGKYPIYIVVYRREKLVYIPGVYNGNSVTYKKFNPKY